MKRRRGYILLTVLLLLMIAAVVMAAFCQLAVQKSLEASGAADELQRRWGIISCRNTILPNAENILELNETAGVHVANLHEAFSLGTDQFAIDICDEQAKVNVNALYSVQGKDRAEQSIQNLVKAAGGHAKPRLRLIESAKLPVKSAASTTLDNAANGSASGSADAVTPIFGSWYEIFPGVERSDLWPDQSPLTRNLTCWGNGSLNLQRASVASITQMCSPDLSPRQISQLLSARTQLGDDATIDDLFNAAHIANAESMAVSGRLTVSSATQSMWIVARDHSGSQSDLFIRDGSNSGDVRSFSFQW